MWVLKFTVLLHQIGSRVGTKVFVFREIYLSFSQNIYEEIRKSWESFRENFEINMNKWTTNKQSNFSQFTGKNL
jgi:hypothetical protein